jgi:hypothetical protein
LWKSSDGLFFEVPPFASDALLTTLHLLFENGLQTVCCKPQEDSGTDNCARPAATRFIFHVRFSISKVLSPLENHISYHCIVSIGLMDEL